MDARKTFLSWPVLRQITGPDVLGRGPAVRSAHTEEITARTTTADRVARSVCPYCAVGCGQRVFVKDEKIVQIAGDPGRPDRGGPRRAGRAGGGGRGQRVFVKDEKIVQIEGDPDSPISRSRLCPKGSASKNLVTSPLRQTKVRYRRPYGTEWEDLELGTAMEMIADRVVKARNDSWQDT